LTVRAAIYGYGGRLDCTNVDCTIAVSDAHGRTLAQAAIPFADDVRPPVPELRLDPPGPYVDGQQVTLHGTGFPPGLVVTDAIGQCPADLDPAVEERCGYVTAGGPAVVVADDGTFAATFPLHAGSCPTPPGCVLAWVIPHGPMGASVPLPFRSG
jgi:hypothetical protein